MKQPRQKEKTKEFSLVESYQTGLLLKVFSLCKESFVEVERTVFNEIVVNKSRIREVAATLKLTPLRVKQILESVYTRLIIKLDNSFTYSDSFLKIKKALAHSNTGLNETKQIKKIFPEKIRVILETELYNLPFSNRLKSIFEYNRIVKVADLVCLQRNKALGLRNFGEKCCIEVETFFKKNELSWGMEL